MKHTNCETCGKDMVSRTNRRFCNQKCYRASNPEPKPEGGWKSICKQCGKETLSQTRKKNWCNQLCYVRYHKVPKEVRMREKSLNDYKDLIEFYERMESQKFYASVNDIFVDLITIADKYVTSGIQDLPVKMQLSLMWKKVSDAYHQIKSGKFPSHSKFTTPARDITRCFICDGPAPKRTDRPGYKKLCKNCKDLSPGNYKKKNKSRKFVKI